LEILEQVEAEITRASSRANKIKLRVVLNYTMKCDIILGRDAIRSLDIVTIKREEREYEVPEILSIDSSVMKTDDTDNLKINPEMPSGVRSEFVKQFYNTYLQAEKSIEPKVKAKIKLYVKDKQTFHFTSGRLSYEEKKRLKEFIDDLLAREIIRAGNSEYASRTVLVKKRTVKHGSASTIAL